MAAEGYRINHGDCREVLRNLPEKSVQCCVTSPPYYGLRDYGLPPSVWSGDPKCEHKWKEDRYYTEQTASGSSAEAFTEAGEENAERVKQARWRKDATCMKCGAWQGCLGLEPTPWMYVEHLVEVFREVHRVLRDDGIAWLNLGDSYNAAGRVGHGTRVGYKQGTNRASATGADHCRASCGPRTFRHGAGRADGVVDLASPRNRDGVHTDVLKPKDLIGIPWRAAFALQADGWWLRSDVIWQKPGCMPESVTDRPTRSHEYIFLLTKREQYFYDAEAVREESIYGEHHARYQGTYTRHKLVEASNSGSLPK